MMSLHCFPRITDPYIRHCFSSKISALIHHVIWQMTSFRLVLVLCFDSVSRSEIASTWKTYMQHKDAEGRLALFSKLSHLSSCFFNVFRQFANRVLESRPRIIHLVYNEDVFANQILHLQTREIQPLCSRYFGARCFYY